MSLTSENNGGPHPPVLRVGSVRASGAGYPNAEQTLGILESSGIASVRDLGAALPPELHLWRIRRSGLIRGGWRLARLGFANLVSVAKVLMDRRDPQAIVYVPYPAVFFLWLVSLLPQRFRPHAVADAYISIWDSLYNDRNRGSGGVLAKLVRAAESRALRAASLVLVDTQANRSFYIDNLGLSPDRVRSIPLAIDAQRFIEIGGHVPKEGKTRVLFVGTMIPLHGIDRILEAARLLRHRADIEFRIVGDGQMSGEVEQILASNTVANISWRRDWIGLDAVAAEIDGAHICLGVFGGGDKAARVLPFKLYYALAAGRAIITQREMSLPAGVPALPAMTISSCEPACLAEAIAHLASDPHERAKLAAAAAMYYDHWLSGRVIGDCWKRLLQESANTKQQPGDFRST